ncbi:YadA-like family protein [Pontixanthobacter aquaemixtae]|uniref:Uncharacterized protein n=1 Tax=Pontixanthobacter aquaemixtae TaxID=1958940 RepID=A0A844ZNR8_9SPHN|nr:YadA-like family protein [Pontixanthobacter aquaemixtae]MXO89398.1 hypothetical protein [Pontixanthobacter aquaemixtae]
MIKQFSKPIAAVLLAGSATIAFSSPAAATECILDTNDNGVADPLDTDGLATSDNPTALACGVVAEANGIDALAVGTDSSANGNSTTAVGGESVATGPGATAIGWRAMATAERAQAFGHLATAQGIRSLAVGENADAQTDFSTAIGNESIANGIDALAIGDTANATGNSTTAVGGESVATGPGATAFGWRSGANAERATALGHLAQADGVRSVAVGEAAGAGADGAIAIGNEASADGVDSIAIGNGATATNDGQVVIANLGTSTASQMGPISVVTADQNGTLGLTTGLASNAAVSANSANITALQTLTANQSARIDDLFGRTAANSAAIDRANEGVAMALAMESPMLPPGTSFALSGGVGYFENQGAGTIAMTVRAGENAAFSAGVGVGFDSGEVGARGGFQVAW